MCSDTLHRQHPQSHATILQAIYLLFLLSFLLLTFFSSLKWTFDTKLIDAMRDQCTAVLNSALLLALLANVGFSLRRLQKGNETQSQDTTDLLIIIALLACAFAMATANINKPFGPALLLCLARRVPSRRVAWVLFVFVASWIILAVVTCTLGLSEDVVKEFSYGTCHSFGFVNPNTLGLYTFLTFAFGWYLFGNRRQVLFAIIGVAVAVLCFSASGSRSAAAMIIVLVVLSAVPRIPKFVPRKVFSICFLLLPLIMAAISILLGVILAPFDDGQSVDSNFVCRFVEGVYAFNQDGIHMLPWDYSTPERQFFFDNAYLYWIFRAGIFAALGFFGFTILTNWLAEKRGDRAEMILIACAALYCCMERSLTLVMLLILAYCYHSSQGKSIWQESES